MLTYYEFLKQEMLPRDDISWQVYQEYRRDLPIKEEAIALIKEGQYEPALIIIQQLITQNQ